LSSTSPRRWNGSRRKRPNAPRARDSCGAAAPALLKKTQFRAITQKFAILETGRIVAGGNIGELTPDVVQRHLSV
jgi:hypothetical protein